MAFKHMDTSHNIVWRVSALNTKPFYYHVFRSPAEVPFLMVGLKPEVPEVDSAKHDPKRNIFFNN